MNKKLIDDKSWIGLREMVIRHLESCSSEEEFLESIERMSREQAIISRLKNLTHKDDLDWSQIQEIIDDFEVKDDKK